MGSGLARESLLNLKRTGEMGSMTRTYGASTAMMACCRTTVKRKNWGVTGTDVDGANAWVSLAEWSRGAKRRVNAIAEEQQHKNKTRSMTKQVM